MVPVWLDHPGIVLGTLEVQPRRAAVVVVTVGGSAWEVGPVIVWVVEGSAEGHVGEASGESLVRDVRGVLVREDDGVQAGRLALSEFRRGG